MHGATCRPHTISAPDSVPALLRCAIGCSPHVTNWSGCSRAKMNRALIIYRLKLRLYYELTCFDVNDMWRMKGMPDLIHDELTLNQTDLGLYRIGQSALYVPVLECLHCARRSLRCSPYTSVGPKAELTAKAIVQYSLFWRVLTSIAISYWMVTSIDLSTSSMGRCMCWQAIQCTFLSQARETDVLRATLFSSI